MTWLRRYWAVVAFAVSLTLLYGGYRSVQDQQRVNDAQTAKLAEQQAAIQVGTVLNRRTVCAITKAITANPIVRIPQFETKAAFKRRVSSLHLILRLSRGINCTAVLAPITVGFVGARPLPLPKGGGALPNQGHQLPGGTRPPNPRLTR